MTVLDASAVLAVVHAEAGSDVAERALRGGTISAANLAEVMGEAVDAGKDLAHVHALLARAGLVVEPVLESDAVLAGALRRLTGGSALSLGDRLCLALTLRSDPPEVLTADRAWAELDLPITVRLIR